MKNIKCIIMYHEKDVNKNRWFIDTFIEKSRKYNIDMRLVTVEEYEKKIADFEDVHAVIARMINPKISDELEKKGVRVFNSAYISKICNNKAECIRHVNSFGVKSIPTIAVNKSKNNSMSFELCGENNSELNAIMKYISHENRLPASDEFIIKSVCGHGGQEVLTLSEYVSEYGDELIVNDAFCSQEKNASDYYTDYCVIQPVVKNEGDVRVYIVGGDIIGAVKRTSDTLKSNYSLGGHVELYKLNESQIIQVKNITENISLDYAGIDFLLVDNEFIFNEIEDVVGARMLSLCSDTDYIELYLKHINNACITHIL